MGLYTEVGIPAITVFLQGILSFFSPCVLPLVPLYISYLAGGTRTVDQQGNVRYSRRKVMVNTLFFVVGVSFAFFLLGLGFTAAGRFFGSNRILFARIGGIIVILFGLYQLGVFGTELFRREHRLPFHISSLAMNPLLALAMGFTFSFAWTPCVGPALASVLLMASSAASQTTGFLLIGVYTLGFVIPFLAVGLFTGTLLDFLKKHQQVVKYTVKAGGALMILMGVMMFTGWMNGITGYLSGFTGGGAAQKQEQAAVPGESGAKPSVSGGSEDKAEPESGESAPESADGQRPGTGDSQPDGEEAQSETTGEEGPEKEDRLPAPDFTLTDQFGEEHTLSDYKGKVVFLNFWATWCGPCRSEMPDIQKMYEKYGGNKEDLVILGVANPKTAENPNNSDASVEEVEQFLEDNGYTFPVAMDTSGDTLVDYYITAFPTTYMIDREGRVIGYAAGALPKDIMENIITQALEEESDAPAADGASDAPAADGESDAPAADGASDASAANGASE